MADLQKTLVSLRTMSDQIKSVSKKAEYTRAGSRSVMQKIFISK